MVLLLKAAEFTLRNKAQRTLSSCFLTLKSCAATSLSRLGQLSRLILSPALLSLRSLAFFPKLKRTASPTTKNSSRWLSGLSEYSRCQSSRTAEQSIKISLYSASLAPFILPAEKAFDWALLPVQRPSNSKPESLTRNPLPIFATTAKAKGGFAAAGACGDSAFKWLIRTGRNSCGAGLGLLF